MSGEVEKAILAFAEEDPTMEVCGVLVSEDVVVKIPNVHSDPQHFFNMDPDVLLDVYEEYGDIDGVWHSHPNGDPQPSTADEENAPPGKRYFIAAAGKVYEYGF